MCTNKPFTGGIIRQFGDPAVGAAADSKFMIMTADCFVD